MSELLRLRRRDLSPVAAHRALQRGDLERIAPGVYRKSDRTPADQDKLQAVALRPHATICLTSALAHHDLILVGLQAVSFGIIGRRFASRYGFIPRSELPDFALHQESVSRST